MKQEPMSLIMERDRLEGVGMSDRRPWELWPGALLIALGVLFLLDTLGVVSAGRVLGTYWPVLVIAAGLLLLWPWADPRFVLPI
ncbi:MAG: DUF5668 domain-containing protein, partial [Chloroflexota bacterium]